MTPALIVLHGSLVVVMFLTMLNDFLRGRRKVGIAGALGIVWVGLLVAVWMTAGWKAALVAFGLSFFVWGHHQTPGSCGGPKAARELAASDSN